MAFHGHHARARARLQQQCEAVRERDARRSSQPPVQRERAAARREERSLGRIFYDNVGRGFRQGMLGFTGEAAARALGV